MANTSSAKKALRVSARKNSVNVTIKENYRNARKDVYKAVLAKDKKKANSLLPKAYREIDFAAKKGTIKKKTADRYKSRLAVAVSTID